MQHGADTNAAIWQSDEITAAWAAEADWRERTDAARQRLMAVLLPFGEQQPFTFLDLGAGTGAAARAVLDRFPRSTAVLADYSAQMMAAAEDEMRAYAGRYRYVEFDMAASRWPAAIPAELEAVVTSMCVHHLPDDRKQGLFAEIFDRLVPGGWYLNYDPVATEDPVAAAAWQRLGDHDDPGGPARRQNRTPAEQARWDNHLRFVSPLTRQLQYLRSAGFRGIDIYWKRGEHVVYGGCRPALP